MRWMGYVRVIGENRNACCILFGNLEERRQLGCPQHTQGGHLFIYLFIYLFKEILCDCVNWIQLIHNRDQERILF